MRIEIQREESGDGDQNRSTRGKQPLQPETALSPALLLGIFTLVAGCAVLAGVGLWLAGQVAGVGPLAPIPTPIAAVAIVNGEPITLQQLDELVAITTLMASLESGQPVTLTPEQWQQARAEMLDQAIRNTLILQAARSVGITVSDNMVEAEWLGWVRKYELAPGELETRLIQNGASPDVLRAWLRNALAANLYLAQYVAPGAQQEERQQIYEQWIQQQLATAQIQVYQMPAN